jgi:hypothetical protein
VQVTTAPPSTRPPYGPDLVVPSLIALPGAITRLDPRD